MVGSTSAMNARSLVGKDGFSGLDTWLDIGVYLLTVLLTTCLKANTNKTVRPNCYRIMKSAAVLAQSGKIFLWEGSFYFRRAVRGYTTWELVQNDRT
jgi:hypothetical protein